MLMQRSPFLPTVTVAGKGSTSSRGSSTGSTNFSSNPARRSAKAALCQPCLSTLPCFSGTAGRTFSNSSSGADPPYPTLPKPKNRSLSVEAESAIVHAEGVATDAARARTPVVHHVQSGSLCSPARRVG
ncbi:vitronectin, isoform CRA_d [Mus musculus]|nr:vitronectin, isoform CRA_d [Mus musculus]